MLKSLRPYVGRRVLVNLNGERGPEAVVGKLVRVAPDGLTFEDATEVDGRAQHQLPGVTIVPAFSVLFAQVV